MGPPEAAVWREGRTFGTKYHFILEFRIEGGSVRCSSQSSRKRKNTLRRRQSEWPGRCGWDGNGAPLDTPTHGRSSSHGGRVPRRQRKFAKQRICLPNFTYLKNLNVKDYGRRKECGFCKAFDKTSHVSHEDKTDKYADNVKGENH